MNQPEHENQPAAAQPSPLPLRGRLLGIDYGTVRVGIAICDENQSIASPLETYTRRNDKLDAGYFQSLVKRERVVGLVVGLPLHMSGDESSKSLEARSYGNWLADVTSLPIVWIDERYSTALAHEILSAGNLTAKQRKVRLDKIAAQSILASFLEYETKTESRAADRNIED